jgi:histidyl-tRNA synthetase
MKDYYGDEVSKLRFLEEKFRKVVESAGYSEVITPILEDFKLFEIKSGEEIKKTMYVFKDKAGREVALRPEFTPSIVRFFLNELQHYPKPIRLYYVGTVYRYDEPQFGRYREFRQAGIELLGNDSILADLEVLQLLYEYYREIDLLDKIKIKLNNIAIYKEIMRKNNISEDLQEHILHLIDKGKKNEALQIIEQNIKNKDDLELIINFLKIVNIDIEKIKNISSDIKNKSILKHLDRLYNIAKMLKKLNYNIIINLSFVRGLAYYTGLIFEVNHEDVDFSIAGGGRYDELVEIYGGGKVPAIGFAIGLERTSLVLKNIYKQKRINIPKIAIILLNNILSYDYVLRIASDLRKLGIIVEFNLKNVSLSKLIPFYSKNNYDYLIIIGDKEIKDNTVTLKNLTTKEQLILTVDKIVDYFRQLL